MGQGRALRLEEEGDVAAAAREARVLALECGLSEVEAQHVATAVSEVARNAVRYARGGEAEIARAVRDGRPGVTVTVRDAGPGIADVGAALRDGVSTGGSLGLGLPGARRLMDDFSIESGPRGTVVSMARWQGERVPAGAPATYAVGAGRGGVALAQPFRNGLLLGVAAGSRAGDVATDWRGRAWHPPARLADRARELLDPGQRLGLALASVSGLDGRVAWLRAGRVGCTLLRADGGVFGFPPAGPALSRTGGGPVRATTLDVRRDDVLVMAAGELDAPALAELAASRGGPDAPALVTARFRRGTLEPRRPAAPGGATRRMGEPGAATTLEEP